MKIVATKIDSTHVRLSVSAIPNALQNKVLKPVIDNMSSYGAKRMRANLKRVARKQKKGDRWLNTGALYASIGSKPAKAMKKSGMLFGGFGVRRSASFGTNKLPTVRKRIARITNFGLKRVKRGAVVLASKKKGVGVNSKQVRPSNYGHLVERGHGGPIYARAYPFAEPTAVEMISYVNSNMVNKIREKWDPALTALGRQYSRTINRGR